jgi:hypothetical protein
MSLQVELGLHFFNMDVVYAVIAGVYDGQLIEMAAHPCTARTKIYIKQ